MDEFNIDSLYQSSLKQFPGVHQTHYMIKPISVETLQEHWGVIWGLFEAYLGMVQNGDLLKKQQKLLKMLRM